MRRPHRLSSALLVLSILVASLGATSCGGGGAEGGNHDLVLVGFNVPNIAGVPLNQPLIFTFNNDIDPDSITPDTLRVVGALGPNFETTTVDGNLVALLPRSPNFESYSDSGLLPGVEYTVSFAKFPAPSTIRTPDGMPLVDAESFNFTTTPNAVFIEPRRPINHGLPPTAGGTSDDEGCLNNFDNALPSSKQSGSDIGARLLCLENQGAPQIILDQCEPTHNDLGVGVPSAVTEGYINLPAIRVRFNEPLDPITVVPYIPTEKFGLNVQLWLVGDTDRVPLPPRQIRTNKPLLVQSLSRTEIILVPANEDQAGDPVGGVPQGTYMVNVTSNLTDLPGSSLDTSTRPNPAIGGFQDIEENVNLSGDVPQGYRMYIVSLVVPGTPTSIIEGFGENSAEHGDAASDDTQPGVYWQSNTGTLRLDDRIPESNAPAAATPEFTLANDPNKCGQSTTANWNGGFRFLGLPSLKVNTDIDDGAGVLRATFKPYLGHGGDGTLPSIGDGTTYTFNTDTGSTDGDGIYQYDSFHLVLGDFMEIEGSGPLVILCRGDFTLDGIVEGLIGEAGEPGLDTNGHVRYENVASMPAAGPGGRGAPGGGDGGMGADPLDGAGLGGGRPGLPFHTVFGESLTSGGLGGDASPSGGGGGGMAVAGGEGTNSAGVSVANAGPISTDNSLTRPLDQFLPDRCYSPNTNGSGGTGGGGGGLHDEDSSGPPPVNGDNGGAGGGGGGGGLYVIAGGMVIVNGTIHADGGPGGDTYAVADQIVDPGPDGTVDTDDWVDRIDPTALGTPSGQGGPGGGGSGGTLFFAGLGGVTIGLDAKLYCRGGEGGKCGDADMLGGIGAPGVIVLASETIPMITVDPGAQSEPAIPTTLVYAPTVHDVSVGQSEWIDLFTDTVVFKKFSWVSNFVSLAGAGLVQGVDYDAWIEVQAAEGLDPTPPGTATRALTNLTAWIPLNSNSAAENSVEWDGAPPSDIDGMRYFRWRWRFRLNDGYPSETEALPAVDSMTIEFER